MNSAEPLVKVTALRAGYGKLLALWDVSFEAFPGEIVAIVGPNGAGKSTLLKAISGELAVKAGAIAFKGTDITRWTVRRRVRAGLVQVPEHRHLFWGMPVEENLELGAMVVPGAIGTKERVLDLFPILGERRHQRARQLSGGQQQMLAIGRGLMANPDLLLLDEPTMGLAPKVVGSLFETLRSLAAAGTTIVLVEQYVKAALGSADRCVVLRNGRVRLAGRASELSEDPDQLHRAYFGVAGDGRPNAVPQGAGS